MPPRFPKPLDVKNAVERRATLRIRWEKDAKLLLLVIKLIESDASNRELSVLSRRIRHEPETRSLVPSTGLSRWLRKEQWKPFFEIYSVPVDTKQNKTADDDVNPKPLPPPLTMLKPLYCHPDADYLEQLK
ncbi:hypothetical protein BDF19DRAFT_420656 [Syncephalis fuscata]|nr:hypothetical protein BDF19DRAFT_420656 [Syncephalis fuscata]